MSQFSVAVKRIVKIRLFGTMIPTRLLLQLKTHTQEHHLPILMKKLHRSEYLKNSFQNNMRNPNGRQRIRRKSCIPRNPNPNRKTLLKHHLNSLRMTMTYPQWLKTQAFQSRGNLHGLIRGGKQFDI